VGPVSTDSTERLIEETVRERFNIDSRFNLKVREFKHSFIEQFVKNNKIFRVDIPTQPPGSVFIALSSDKEIFYLPSEFNKFIATEDIWVDTNQKAIAVARFYLALASDNILILQRANDIPYSGNYGKDPENYTSLVIPPYAFSKNNGYQVNLYFWNKNNGAIVKCSFDIERNGWLTIKKSMIADRVGDFIGLE
jgi:hypothetical protein